jgi:hypothetical protein
MRYAWRGTHKGEDDPKVWTEDEELWGIVVDGPPERESA